MEDVVARLERVAARLEAVQVRAESGSGAPAAPAPPHVAPAPTSTPPAATPAAGPGADSVAAFQALLSGEVAALVDAGEAVGGEVLKATRILAEGFHREANIVAAFAACTRPTDPADMQMLLQPVADKMMEAESLSSGPRSPYADHFRVTGEAVQALSWVAYQPGCGLSPPPQHVEDAWGAAEFYANKVLMGWKGKGPEHGAWVAAVKAAVLGLRSYCARFHAAGPAWKPAGVALKGWKPGAAPAAAAAAVAAPKKAGPPPPPPPPPPGTLIRPKEDTATAAAAAKPAPAAAAGGAMAALFADINKGASITSGLRKVTDEMKTKNREDRSGAVPAASATSSAPTTTATAKPAAKPAAAPPRLECEQGRRWVVENWTDNRELLVEATDPKQSVYIFNCSGCTVQVKGKVNAITLDACSRTGLLFESVVASCEVVNCKSVQVQCTGDAPTVSVEKTDGCQLFLREASLAAGAAVTSAKTSELNVVAMGEGEAEPREFAVPEQFVSRYKDGRLVTEAVQHSGG